MADENKSKAHPATSGGSHFIFSAEKPRAENKTGMTPSDVLAKLRSWGETVEETHGKYTEPEKSFIVHNPKNISKLHNLAANLGQESAIVSDKGRHSMHYYHGGHAGKIRDGEGTQVHAEEPEDNYTKTTNHDGSHSFFSHNFDWDNNNLRVDLGKKEITSRLLSAFGGSEMDSYLGKSRDVRTENRVHVIVDGDATGAYIARSALAKDTQEVIEKFENITQGKKLIKKWAFVHNGDITFDGSDKVSFTLPENQIPELESLRRSYRERTGLTISIGVGSSADTAKDGLLYGKLTHKGEITTYSPEIEKSLKESAADKETKVIRENAKDPENQKEHRFFTAKWTHPNGHPRCFLCGDEESMDGFCSPKILKNETYPKVRLHRDDILASHKSVDRAAVSNLKGKGSHTPGDIDVWRLEDGRHLLVDGHHRFAAGIKNGQTHFNANVVGSGYSDYHAVPSKGDEFKGWDKVKKDELEKGQNGDWQKEGYRLEHSEIEPGHYLVVAKHPSIYRSPIPGMGNGIVGYAEFSTNRKKLIPEHTEVHREHVRKGLASGMYKYIEEITGSKIRPSRIQTDYAKALWNQPERPFGKSDLLPRAKSLTKNDLEKHVFKNNTWYPEASDPDGSPHPTDPNKIKGTAVNEKASYYHKPELAARNEQRFTRGILDYHKNSKMSQGARDMVIKLAQKVAVDPDRHAIGSGTTPNAPKGHQELRLRHLSSVAAGEPGYEITEHEGGIKITAPRHSGSDKSNVRSSSWHFDGKNLKFLGNTPIRDTSQQGGFDGNDRRASSETARHGGSNVRGGSVGKMGKSESFAGAYGGRIKGSESVALAAVPVDHSLYLKGLHPTILDDLTRRMKK